MARIMEQYQLRVVGERDELQNRFERLESFIHSSQFAVVDDREQNRLRDQMTVMRRYLEILNERIINF